MVSIAGKWRARPVEGHGALFDVRVEPGFAARNRGALETPVEARRQDAELRQCGRERLPWLVHLREVPGPGRTGARRLSEVLLGEVEDGGLTLRVGSLRPLLARRAAARGA